MSTPGRVCVFLLQLGGPERLEDIQPFLENLFEDVLPVPRFLRGPVGRYVARRRAPKVRPLYARMGNGSPLRKNTDAQAQALEARLKALGLDARVLVAMRYAPPRASAALLEARQHWSDATWVTLPLYPQYSFATTRSSIDELTAQLTTPEQELTRAVTAYPDDGAYLDAMTETVREALSGLSATEREQAHLLFSAHGLPMSLVKEGDPYPEHVQKTVDGIAARLKVPNPIHLSFQSRVGPARWLKPATDQRVRELGGQGVKSLVVVPVSFVSDHIETLSELDDELKHIATASGITTFVRAPVVATRPSFIDALAQLVVRTLD